METLVGSELGDRLKLLRQRLGITGAQLAKEADIPLPVIKTVEQGITLNPGYKLVEKLVKRYGVNANWLIAGSGEMFDGSPFFEKENKELKAEVQEKDALIQMLERAMIALKKTRRVPERPTDLIRFRPLFG